MIMDGYMDIKMRISTHIHVVSCVRNLNKAKGNFSASLLQYLTFQIERYIAFEMAL